MKRNHLSNFIDAYNFARRLKTLNALTPYEYVCKIWTNMPEIFDLNPNPSTWDQPLASAERNPGYSPIGTLRAFRFSSCLRRVSV
jgi:hypothetical protein